MIPGQTPSPFIEELQRILASRRLSWRKLAELTGYHPSWLSKIKNGAQPSADLVRRCDEVLEAKGRLITLAGVGQRRRPAQLPAPPAGFIGRDSELLQLSEVLIHQRHPSGPTVVAIDGPPGAGKTSMALKYAHSLIKSHPDLYPDGQLYVNLRGYSPDGRPAKAASVLEEFLIALGAPPNDIPSGVEQRAKLYRSLLASRKLLIVLDNAASSDQVEPLLPGASNCGVVLTSRKRLTVLAMRVTLEHIPLGPLPQEESMTLLQTVIQKVRTDIKDDDLATLARWCGHLPLALRIVAERVVAHRYHPVSELIEELANERQRLDALTTDESVAVRTAFEWSYRDLDQDEALMFQKLGLHRGPHVSVEAAAALVGKSTLHARRSLLKLATVRLVEGAPDGRYHFHDLLRVYAAERLEAESTPQERSLAVRRLVDWYLHSVVAGSRVLAPFRLSPIELDPPAPGVVPLTFYSDRTALQWYDIEAPNFVSVIRLTLDYQLYETAWMLAIALFDYLRLLRKPGGLWLATCTLAEKAARAAGNRSAQGWITTSLAEAYRWLRQYDRSRQGFKRGLVHHQTTGDRHGQAWALAGLGFLSVDCGSLDDAHEYALKALALFEEIGDRHGQASALFTMADAYQGWHRRDDAFDALLASLKILKEIGNHDGQGLTLAKIGETHSALGEHEQALDYFDRSLESRRLAGSRWGEADALARRGRTLEALDRPEEAWTSWEAALTLYEDVDDPRAQDIHAYLQGRTPEPGTRVLSPPAW